MEVAYNFVDDDIIEESCSSSNYDSDSSLEEGYLNTSDSDSEVDYTESAYNIATQPVTSVPDLTDANVAWSKVVEEKDGHFNVDFNDSCAGPKHIGQSKEPFDVFNLLFTSYLWNMIVLNTNKYAKKENLKSWKDVNKKTMMGLNDYWSKRGCIDTPWFRKIMGRDLFKRIHCAFHIVDNSTLPKRTDPAYRPCCRVKPLLEYIYALLLSLTMCCCRRKFYRWQGFFPIRQYLPN